MNQNQKELAEARAMAARLDALIVSDVFRDLAPPIRVAIRRQRKLILDHLKDIEEHNRRVQENVAPYD